MLHLLNIFPENDGKENCAQLLEEECIKMFGTRLYDEHDCNVVSMNSLNIHDANNMQSNKLGEAMFDEYESGFGRVSTLFSDDSTISEEIPIDYENKVAIYDDYWYDLYAIKSNDNHETCHHDFNFQLDYVSHVILLSLLPL